MSDPGELAWQRDYFRLFATLFGVLSELFSDVSGADTLHIYSFYLLTGKF